MRGYSSFLTELEGTTYQIQVAVSLHGRFKLMSSERWGPLPRLAAAPPCSV